MARDVRTVPAGRPAEIDLTPWWPRVERMARGYARLAPGWADHEGMVQAARLALWEAARKFDASRGVPFDKFLALYVRGRIQDFVRGEGWRDYRRASWARVVGFGALRMPSNDADEGRGPRGLDALLVGREGDPGEALAARDFLAAALAGTPEGVTREILRLRYGEGLMLKAIGERLGFSESRASQLHKQAILALRARLGDPRVPAPSFGRGHGVNVSPRQSTEGHVRVRGLARQLAAAGRRLGSDLADAIAGVEPDPLRPFKAADPAALYAFAIEVLPTKQREVVRLLYLHNATPREAGNRFNLDEFHVGLLRAGAYQTIRDVVQRRRAPGGGPAPWAAIEAVERAARERRRWARAEGKRQERCPSTTNARSTAPRRDDSRDTARS